MILALVLAFAESLEIDHQPIAASLHISHSIRYVSVGGNDSNDGLGVDTAKATMFAALCALPRASCLRSPYAYGTGTVYVLGAVPFGGPATSQGGFWVMGDADPNYTKPLTGWAHLTGSIYVKCIDPDFGASGGIPQCGEHWGNPRNRNQPAVWVSASNTSIKIEGFGFQYPARGWVLGECSDNSTNCGVQNVAFKDCTIGLNQIAGNGPAIEVRHQSFWNYFDHSGGGGNAAEVWRLVTLLRSRNVLTITTASKHDIPVGGHASIYSTSDATFNGTCTAKGVTATTITCDFAGHDGPAKGGYVLSDLAYGFLFNPELNSAGPSAEINDSQDVAGIKAYHAGLTIHNVNWESMTGPAVWMSDGGQVFIDNGQSSDFAGESPIVRNDQCMGADCGSGGFATLESNSFGSCSLDGPGEIISGQGNFCQSIGPSNYYSDGGPGANGAYGIIGARAFLQQDSSRRAFGPTAVRFANLAPQDASYWSVTKFDTSSRLTVGVAALDGTFNAATGSATKGPQEALAVVNGSSLRVSPGDYFVWGAWVRSSTGDFSGGPTGALQFYLTGARNYVEQIVSGSAALNTSPAIQGFPQWQWVYGAGRVTEVTTNPAQLYLESKFGPTVSVTVYAPILLHIPLSSNLPSSEIYEMALHLQSYGDNCPVGTVCGVRGETLFEPGIRSTLATKSSTYKLTPTDRWVNVTGTTTITVPHAIVGQLWDVFNSGSRTVTIQPDSGKINGTTSVFLSPNTGKSLTCDGTNCFAH